ncbi:MAG: DUF721 domain-containing protein [Alphaproteobacteria bacterium]
MDARDRNRKTGNVAARGGYRERRPGLRPIGEASARVAAPIVARRGGSVPARLKAEWSAIAGAELAARTWPVKLGRDGALKLLVIPGFAPDLQHRAPLVIDRINLFFGRTVVARLILVQGSLPLAGAASLAAKSRMHAEPPTSNETEMPDSRLSGVDDPELRAALTGLGELVWRVSRPGG